MLLADEERARRVLDRRPGERPDKPCPGPAFATTRRATSCATRCSSAMACCSITRRARSRASPASPKWSSHAYPDKPRSSIRKSQYFDAKSTRDDAALGERRRAARAQDAAAAACKRDARAPALASMRVLQRGNRLSITPVTPKEWQAVLACCESRSGSVDIEPCSPSSCWCLGTCTGFLAGLLGIGGGMLMVPFVTLLLTRQGRARRSTSSRWRSPRRWRRSASRRWLACARTIGTAAVRWDIVRTARSRHPARRPALGCRVGVAAAEPRARVCSLQLFVGSPPRRCCSPRSPPRRGTCRARPACSRRAPASACSRAWWAPAAASCRCRS